MTTLQKRIASVVTSAALLLNLAAPAFATTTIEISGNGVGTDNDANVTVSTTTVVAQTNIADLENNVGVLADTGGNDANSNTGGDVLIDTGNAKVDVSIANEANSNVADVDGCCDLGGDVLISGNGDSSTNTANVGLSSSTTVVQSNIADVDNNVYVAADTGDNDANSNTGGSVTITTGDALVNDGVSISNDLNHNSARVGGNGTGAGSLSARILGNGVGSDNDINLALARAIVLNQSNIADVENNVGVLADTGGNDANSNTGGDVLIDTGNAKVDVSIDNAVNFNWADVDCGCLLSVLAKLAGNGDSSLNTINATLSDGLVTLQSNIWLCEGYPQFPWDWEYGEYYSEEGCNNVGVYADTGDNDANSNTGGVDGGDPSIVTGNAEVGVSVENAGNSNVFGSVPSEPPFEFPDLGDIEVGFDWAAFVAWFVGFFGA